MSKELIEKLETKVDNAIEVIELLRLQVEELEDANKKANEANAKLNEANTCYENNINSLLDKLAKIEASNTAREASVAQSFVPQAEVETV